jgi:hypothetical protein
MSVPSPDWKPYPPYTGRARFEARVRLPFLVVLLLAAIASVVAGLPPALASAPAPHHRGIHVPRWYFGLHDYSQKAYGHLSFGSLRIWDSGATWKDIETSPGHYRWSQLDSLVSAAQSHHVRVTLVLGMTPSFYASQPSQLPADLRHFRDYARAVMERYQNFHGHRGISAYQVWNEGNVPLFWTGSAHQLAHVTQIVHQVRDEVDPRAVVVAPSFAVRLPSERQWLADYQSQRVSRRPVWRFYDANAVSLYPKASYDGRIGGPEDAFALVHKIRRQFAAIGIPARMPLWASEINYGVKGLSGASAQRISEGRQVANVLRTYLLGAAHHLAAVYWYRYDWGETADGGTLGNTLLADPSNFDAITPAGAALVRVEHWLQGRLVGRSGHPPCASDRRGTYTCVVRYSGGVRRIYWNPSRGVHLRINGAVSFQDQSGQSTKLGASEILRVDYRPIVVKWRS